MTLRSYEFTVPQKPQGKGRGRAFRVGKGVRIRTPDKTRNYEALIADMAAEEMDGRPMLQGPLALELVATFPRSKHLARISKRTSNPIASPRAIPYTGKPDLDNIIKAICDACNGVVFKDDSQVVRITACKEYAWMFMSAGRWYEMLPSVGVVVTELEGL